MSFDFAARHQHRRAAIPGTQIAASLVTAGVTAVRDPGTTGDVALRLKEAVARGLIPGPRIFWVGALIAMTSGHADEATGTATGRWKPDLPNTRTYAADGPWEWRKAVREQIRRQADWIKVTAPFTKEEIAAGADILGMGDKLGTIEPGKIADLVVLARNPEDDLVNLRALRYVKVLALPSKAPLD